MCCIVFCNLYLIKIDHTQNFHQKLNNRSIDRSNQFFNCFFSPNAYTVPRFNFFTIKAKTKKLWKKLARRPRNPSKTSARWRVWLRRRRWWTTTAACWLDHTTRLWRRPTSPPSLSPSLQASSSSPMLPLSGLELTWLRKERWITQMYSSEWKRKGVLC